MNKIQMEERHFVIVRDILKKFKIIAYVFGSRAKNQAKQFSDLDLCLKDNYDKSAVSQLQDAFEDSDLPFKVDIVVWSQLTENFKTHIQKDLIKFE